MHVSEVNDFAFIIDLNKCDYVLYMTTSMSWEQLSDTLFLTESWTGRSIHEHTIESGPEPYYSGHARDVFRFLHCSERQRYNREAQGEFFFFPTGSFVLIFSLMLLMESQMNMNCVYCFFTECSVGPVHKICPYEQDEATTAHFGQKWLLAASCVALWVQGAAPPYAAEDDAPQSRERHSEWDSFSFWWP